MDKDELNAIRARIENHGMAFDNDWLVPDAIHDYVCDVPRLLAEVERQRESIDRLWRDVDQLEARAKAAEARETAMREIVQAFAKDNGPLVQDREYGAYDCGRCDGVPEQWKDGTYAMERDAFIHAPDCPVTKARELLGKEGE